MHPQLDMYMESVNSPNMESMDMESVNSQDMDEKCPLLQEYSKDEKKKQESVWNDCKAALYSTLCMSYEEKEEEKFNVWCKNDEMYHEQIFGTKMSEEKKRNQYSLYKIHCGYTRYTHLKLLPVNTPMSLIMLIQKERKEHEKAVIQMYKNGHINFEKYMMNTTQLPEHLPANFVKLCSKSTNTTQLPEYLPVNWGKFYSKSTNTTQLPTPLPPKQTHTSSNNGECVKPLPHNLKVSSVNKNQELRQRNIPWQNSTRRTDTSSDNGSSSKLGFSSFLVY
jgi:hypothetical protein